MKAVKFTLAVVAAVVILGGSQVAWLYFALSFTSKDPTVGGAVCVVWAGGMPIVLTISVVAMTALATMVDRWEEN